MSELQEHAYQQAFRESFDDPGVETAAFFGGLQAGKSVAGADALHYGIYQKGWQLPDQTRGRVHPEVWVASRSYVQVRTAWDTYVWRHGDTVISREECRSMGLERGDSQTYWLRPPTAGDWPIRCRLRTARDPEALRATQHLLAAWCDEIAHWPELAWHNLQGRSVVTRTKYIITTTPKGKNFLYRDVWVPGDKPGEKGTDPAIRVVRCRSIDNPWASAERIEKMRRLFGRQYAEQELDGMFVQDSGLVYSFDRERHMRRRPAKDDITRCVIGVDPGYGAAYAIEVLGKTTDGTWWVLDDWKRQHQTTDAIRPVFDRLIASWEPSAIYVDIRRPTDISILRGWYPNLVRANRELFAENERRTVMPMIRYVEGLLSSGKLMVNEECEATAEEFEHYHYPDADEKDAGENPVKWMDDCLDALRYAICSEEHYMALDTRPRYRQGLDQKPKVGPEPLDEVPEAERYLQALDKHMDEAEERKNRTR